jgi:hypothetical protein
VDLDEAEVRSVLQELGMSPAYLEFGLNLLTKGSETALLVRITTDEGLISCRPLFLQRESLCPVERPAWR